MDTKDNILALAETLIRTKGYHAFSYNDISKPLQIKNAAIHYHYPSKKDLGIAVIQRNRLGFLKRIHVLKIMTASKQLSNFMSIYKESQRAGLICFMGALGSGYDSLPKEMQVLLSEVSSEIRVWLTQILKKGKAENAFSFKESAQEKADLISSSLLASLILNKVTGEDITKSVVNAILKETLQNRIIINT